MNSDQSFGEWLRQRRRIQDLTLDELARRVGCSTVTLLQLEAETRRPSKQMAERLAGVLLVAPNDWPAFLRFARGDPSAKPDRKNAPETPEQKRTQRHNLPQQLSSFVGREHEIVEVERLLKTTRLLTLTGPGGCGKTRLALAAANECLPGFEHGVWLTEFAPLADPALVPQAVASSLGADEQPGRSLMETLSNHLEKRQVLLVFDNCEHLAAACAQLAEALLRACPNLRILATSREMLNLAGESIWVVPPLSLPVPQPWRSPLSGQQALGAYQGSEAVRLFADRAIAVSPGFLLSADNGPWVAHICIHLDGMPLAIELAAARVRALSVQQIAERLQDRFHLLTGGHRTAPSRHQTLAATLDWSYALLPAAEQLALQRLAVFASGWDLPAAEAVCAGEAVETADVLDLLTHLVDKSLVVAERQDGEMRYRMLETIRQYAREKLTNAGDGDATRRRYLQFYLRFAQEADARLHGSDQLKWLDRLDLEFDNLRDALDWAFRAGQSSEGAQLAAALIWYFFVRNRFREAQSWAEQAEVLTRDAPSRERAAALFALGFALAASGEHERAEPVLQQALALYRNLNDPRRLSFIINTLAYSAGQVGEVEQANQYAEEALAIRRATGDTWGVTHTLQMVGAMAEHAGDFVRAKAIYEEALRLSEELDDERMIARRLADLGNVAFVHGDLAQAEAMLKHAVSIAWRMREMFSLLQALEPLARVLAAQGQTRLAILILGASETARAEIGIKLSAAERTRIDQLIVSIQNREAGDRLAGVYDEGRALPLEHAVERALREQESTRLPPAEKAQYGGLTKRERQVAALIAQGKSNRQIAAAMVVGARTVETYVTRILAKLGFDSRVQIATWAIEKGLALPQR